MRIGVLSTCEHYAWAGTEEVWYHFADRALDEGHDVLLAAHVDVASSSQVKQLQNKGLNVCSRKPIRPQRLYLWKERIRSEMSQLESCDVVIVNAGSLFDTLNLPWIGGMVTRLASQGKRLIYFCHFCAESLPATGHSANALQALTSQFSDWVFVSEHNRDLARRQLASQLPNAVVVMNGPRLRMDSPLPFAAGPLTLGCVARLETRWKGHDVLLECMASDRVREAGLRLNIYGSGPDEDYVRRLIQHYDLSGTVTMKGYVRDMQQVWAECHAMALASHGEGTPLAVLEAMMCGRITITTDVGGNLEVLDDGVTGFVADAATPRSFLSTLNRAIQRKADWQTMGAAAHKAAVDLANADPAGRLLSLVLPS